mgnify:CR=1 FL=1
MCTAPHPALALFKRLFEEAEANDPIAMPKDYVQRNWLWDPCAKNGIEVPTNPIQAWEWEEEIGLAKLAQRLIRSHYRRTRTTADPQMTAHGRMWRKMQRQGLVR